MNINKIYNRIVSEAIFIGSFPAEGIASYFCTILDTAGESIVEAFISARENKTKIKTVTLTLVEEKGVIYD